MRIVAILTSAAGIDDPTSLLATTDWERRQGTEGGSPLR